MNPGRTTEARRRAAEDFLQRLLAAGPIVMTEIRARAKASGIPWRAVCRAAAALRVQSHKAGFRDGWTWSLPPKNVTDRGNGATATEANSGSLRVPLAELVTSLHLDWTPQGDIKSLAVPKQDAEAFAAHRQAVFDILRRARGFRRVAREGCVGCSGPLADGHVLCESCKLALRLAVYAGDGSAPARRGEQVGP